MRSQIGIIILFVLLLATSAAGHDQAWQSGKRNAAGEWCCGVGDCFVMPAVRRDRAGNFVIVLPTMDGASTEVVPEREAQPSPDGQHWRCQRPDGSRRCFFAPPDAT